MCSITWYYAGGGGWFDGNHWKGYKIIPEDCHYRVFCDDAVIGYARDVDAAKKLAETHHAKAQEEIARPRALLAEANVTISALVAEYSGLPDEQIDYVEKLQKRIAGFLQDVMPEEGEDEPHE